jgi:beta-glucosidase-like glycosyl hydrolase
MEIQTILGFVGLHTLESIETLKEEFREGRRGFNDLLGSTFWTRPSLKHFSTHGQLQEDRHWRSGRAS